MTIDSNVLRPDTDKSITEIANNDSNNTLHALNLCFTVLGTLL